MLRKAIPLSYLDDPIRQCSAAPAKPLAADIRSFDVKSENSSLAVTLFGALCVGAGTALPDCTDFHIYMCIVGPYTCWGAKSSRSSLCKRFNCIKSC